MLAAVICKLCINTLAKSFLEIMDDQYKRYIEENLEKRSSLSGNGACRLWKGSKTRKGYGQANWRSESGQRNKCPFLVHRLAYGLKIGTMEFGGPGLCVSHLCHNKLCITADHLSLESLLVNNRRQNCVFRRICSGHGSHPKCLLDLKL